MEYNKTEVGAIEKSMNEAVEAQMLELTELQLAAIGGGIGEVVAG
jgi:hypothetical protein